MKKQDQLTAQEWQLLSAYVDDQLTEKEKRQAEQLLKSRPVCQAALEDLKYLQALLRSLPMRRVPRNFTLSAKPAVQARLPAVGLVLRAASLVTAVLLGFALALDYLPPLQPLAGGLPLTASESARPSAAEMALPTSEDSPAIIYWGGPPAMGAYGKGGSGAEGMRAAPDVSYGIGGDMPEVGLAAPDALPPEAQMAAPEVMPEAQLLPLPAAPETEEAPAEMELEALPEAAIETPPERRDSVAVEEGEALAESEPSLILGVRPPEERGRMEALTLQTSEIDRSVTGRPLRTIQVLLGVILALTAIPAWLLQRRKSGRL